MVYSPEIWQKNYPESVPKTINCKEFDSLSDYFSNQSKHFGQRVAFRCLGQSLTFQALENRSSQLAAFFQSLGLNKGDRIAIMLPNLLQYPIAMIAALKAGLVVVNVNPLYTERELSYQLNDADIHALIVLSNFADTVEKSKHHAKCLEHIIVTDLGDELSRLKATFFHFILKLKGKIPKFNLPNAINWREIFSKEKEYVFNPVSITREDIAYLQYTGGTTGVPKAAILSHGNILANIAQARSWIDPLFSTSNEVIITAIPLYHIFALTANCWIFMALGAENVLVPNPRDLKSFVRLLGKTKYTAITGVNTLFNHLIHDEYFRKQDFSHLNFLRVMHFHPKQYFHSLNQAFT